MKGERRYPYSIACPRCRNTARRHCAARCAWFVCSRCKVIYQLRDGGQRWQITRSFTDS